MNDAIYYLNSYYFHRTREREVGRAACWCQLPINNNFMVFGACMDDIMDDHIMLKFLLLKHICFCSFSEHCCLFTFSSVGSTALQRSYSYGLLVLLWMPLILILILFASARICYLCLLFLIYVFHNLQILTGWKMWKMWYCVRLVCLCVGGWHAWLLCVLRPMILFSFDETISPGD